MAERTVILHYHLFKNAGTSVDRILKRSFGEGWVTAEFPTPRTGSNSDAVAEWIRQSPSAVAFSSHTAQGPVPVIDGVRIIPLIFLRDPIDRIRSAYRFEKIQQADTGGAQLAKTTDFEGYVRTQLAIPGHRQCRNFHVARLASFVPGTEPELERAMAALERLGMFGLVEEFDTSMQRISARLQAVWPEFAFVSAHANKTEHRDDSQSTSAELEDLLAQANADDLALLARARALFRDAA